MVHRSPYFMRVATTLQNSSPKTQLQEDAKHNRRILRERQRRILNRIENHPGPERNLPMMTATSIHYELAERVQGLAAGGIGACSCWHARSD